MWRYRARLPAIPPAAIVTLGEGATPLIPSALVPGLDLHLKDETRNPTGSHKDRALALAISDARARGVTRSVVVSAGSTGLSHAAYCARAGIQSIVLMAEDTPLGRARLLQSYGGRTWRVRGAIDPIIAAVERLGAERGLHVASTTRRSNPVQAEAGRTIAYEILDQLGRAPDLVLVPTGGGGTLAALGRGFAEHGRLPRLVAIVPEHWNALEIAHARGVASAEAFAALPMPDPPSTVLGKLAHGHPPDGFEALEMIRASGGRVIGVGDAEALAAQAWIAHAEGLFVEPSTAVIVPALERLCAEGAVPAGRTVVALLCGSGFRELPFLPAAASAEVAVLSLDELESVLLDGEGGC